MLRSGPKFALTSVFPPPVFRDANSIVGTRHFMRGRAAGRILFREGCFSAFPRLYMRGGVRLCAQELVSAFLFSRVVGEYMAWPTA